MGYNVGKTNAVNHPPVITNFIDGSIGMYTVGGIFTIPSYGWFMTMFYPNYPIFCLYTENDGAIKNFGQTRAWTNP